MLQCYNFYTIVNQTYNFLIDILLSYTFVVSDLLETYYYCYYYLK